MRATEFKISKHHHQTVHTLESASGGSTSAGSIASVDSPMVSIQRRNRSEDNILAQEANKEKPVPTPRNFVAKNAKISGAGQHKDKKKEQKQGVVKHKKSTIESLKNRVTALHNKLAEARIDPDQLSKLAQLKKQLEKPKTVDKPAELTPQQQAEIAQWEKDFSQRMATRSTEPTQSKARRFVPSAQKSATTAEPEKPVSYEFPKTHSELVQARENLNQVIEIKKKIDKMVERAGGSDALPAGIRFDIDDSLYMQGAEKDGYKSLLDKNLKSLGLLQKHLKYKSVAYKESAIREGKVKELANDLKKMSDTEFHEKYKMSKAAARKKLKSVDEGRSNPLHGRNK
jgi:hypothetical protein